MTNPPIIKSLLDTDTYKLTMGQVALRQFPTVNVKYEFKCRNKATWTEHIVNEIRLELANFSRLRFSEDELRYLRSLEFIKDDYVDFLRLYQPNINHLSVIIDSSKQLKITVDGPWYLTIFWEVPLLAIVNEVYFRNGVASPTFYGGESRLDKKIETLSNNDVPVAEFGTRRRFSSEWQRKVVKRLSEELKSFCGTSNMLLAKDLNVPPIGTMAHEFLQVGQALDVPLIDSQKRMLQAWIDEYRGMLGVALTDIVGFDAFLRDFDKHFANSYVGLRHDSGDPKEWADKAIAHYESLGIDPKSKVLVFSDGLNAGLASELKMYVNNRAQVMFGIGTNLTNDFSNITPLQIVMKIVECNGMPVAKLSDSPGKSMCNDEEYVTYLKKVFKIT